VIASAELVNARLGHENLGSLSGARGFVPVQPPRLSLPDSHAAWDDVAAQLPALCRDLTLRPALEQLPVLPADATALPDAALSRAATVLGLLAHAYMHLSAPQPGALPEGIAVPWAQVRRRLHRDPEPVLSYVDLIVNNWRGPDEDDAQPLRVGNLRLLVPTVDNQEERVFYLSQLEILARCAPIVPAVAAAHDAVLNDDPQALRQALDAVTGMLGTVSSSSLTLIDPRPGSATHVDPVVWAKTVAPLAVPFRAGVLGPSGTASPIFNLLDVFLGRRWRASQLGSEIGRHRRSYPVHWRRFLDAVERVSVADHVAAHPAPGLAAALDGARDAYAGPGGFLGQHRRKVYGYLSVAFKVGRGVTIGGFTGSPQDRTWNQVDAALTESRGERLTGEASSAPRCRDRPAGSPTGCPERAAPAGRAIAVSELTGHTDDEHGWWVAVGGRVHDVTRFIERHPGGDVGLRAHAGLDVTDAFARAHAGHSAAGRLLARTDIGFLLDPGVGAAGEVYRPWVAALFTVVELQNTFRLDRSFGRGTDLCVPGGHRASAFQRDRAADTHARFADRYLPECADQVLGPLLELLPTVAAAPAAGSASGAALSIRAIVPAPRAPSPGPGGDGRLRADLDDVDRRLAQVTGLLRTGARLLEQYGADALDRGHLPDLVQRSIEAFPRERGHGWRRHDVPAGTPSQRSAPTE
jgi:Indoleamine 2,3-dioxygenase/Cytochrome b5-like Heme/Steroid binding domain